MRGGARRFRRDFPGPAVLRIPSGRPIPFAYRAVTFCGGSFQNPSTRDGLCNSPVSPQQHLEGPTTPAGQRLRAWHPTSLGCSRFARRYSGNRGCFLFLGVLRCFSSPACLLTPYVFRRGYWRITTSRFPHSDISGSKPVRRLPEAFRSLPRPSSAPGT